MEKARILISKRILFDLRCLIKASLWAYICNFNSHFKLNLWLISFLLLHLSGQGTLRTLMLLSFVLARVYAVAKLLPSFITVLVGLLKIIQSLTAWRMFIVIMYNTVQKPRATHQVFQFFFGHWLLYYSFLVPSLYLTIFRALFSFLVFFFLKPSNTDLWIIQA